MLHKLKLLLPKKGSVLVFSLIILAFMLVSALSVAMISVTEKRASLATDKSSRSFQVADTGVETILQKIYKGGFDSAPLSALGSCSSGDISDASAGYVVSFYKSDGTKMTDCTSTSWRNDVARIKSEGTAGNTKRAVEVAIAATGDYQLSCVGGAGNLQCCRINTNTGAVTCQVNPGSGSWTNASDPDNSNW